MIITIAIIIIFSSYIESKFTKKLCTKNENKINNTKEVRMNIKENTLTKKGTLVTITDTTRYKNTYDDEFRIDEKKDGKWKEVKRENTIIAGIGSKKYYVDENSKLEMDIEWEWKYGELENGEYRMVKSAFNEKNQREYYISSEFKIK